MDETSTSSHYLFVTDNNNNDIQMTTMSNIQYANTYADIQLPTFGDYENITNEMIDSVLLLTMDTGGVHDPAYWALSLLFIPAFTIFGNILVILSVIKFKSLQSAINYFIVALAIADCLVAFAVMPFAVYVHVCYQN
jgi:hypothetical protein